MSRRFPGDVTRLETSTPGAPVHPRLPLAGDAIARGFEVFVFRASPARGAALLDRLSDGERARIDQHPTRERQLRYAAVRGTLRMLLAHRLRMAPAAVPIVAGPLGKPHVCATLDRRVDFSVSHSGSWAAIAISTRGAIGVDIEVPRPRRNIALAVAALSARERAWLDRADAGERQARFMTLWTAKEASVKLWGCGLRVPLAGVELQDPGAPRAVVVRRDPLAGDQCCLVHRLSLPRIGQGAVAVPAEHGYSESTV